MKKLTISLLASLAMAATTFAGHEMATGKDSKDKGSPEPLCFNDKELQLDIFGIYTDGNGLSHAGNVQDHGWGGGVGVNYFFTRNIGVGGEWQIVDSKRNDAQPGVSGHNSRTAQNAVNGSLIFRLPIDRMCLAPYTYVGGGAVLAGEDWAQVFVGLGLEYRVVPNKVGLFFDTRWTYLGDRFGKEDQNNFSARTGVRWVF